jgi:Helix-turn-helix of DDE superfamily endonuclease
MTYKQIKNLEEKEFKRLCGVKPKLFKEMVEVLKEKSLKGRPRGGQTKLSVEDQLLITLEYWREYRTYFHIAQSWRVHESTVCRTVHRVEDRLIKSKKFSLPGKKSLSNTEIEWSVVIMDVAESPIERPKKNRKVITVEKRKGIL